ncbi:MAG TPA: UDP-galactopyranose mutase [Terracidiphilus sp.]|nr:UDP-galactopyranose mutase [Terracidiphilus sp.]
MSDICVIGAGFSGAVIARELALAGLHCDVFEARSHVAGNCHTERDAETGILVHAYGPHIFHTNNRRVWDYVRQFDEFVSFTNRVKAVTGGRVYSLPINLLTINQFFGKTLSPSQAKDFLVSQSDHSFTDPKTFEEQALRFVGRELYEAFFRGYTTKQWGVEPSRLPASILKRLPVRFNYNDNYYDSQYQGIPRNGYTHIVERILDHPNITLRLNSSIGKEDVHGYRYTFYTGPLDAWFGHSEGRLTYRTLDFVKEVHDGDFQGNPVINYCDQSVPWTRISEHKHFAPWETFDQTIIFREYSRQCGVDDLPYYPVRLAEDHRILDRYTPLIQQEKNVTFAGRLGTYRYLDMHVTIEEALNLSEKFVCSL